MARLVDEAHGSPVHSEGAKAVPHFNEAAIHPPASNGAGNGHAPLPRADADPAINAATAADAAGPEPVAVPSPPSASRPEAESWPPPPWPPPAEPEAPPAR